MPPRLLLSLLAAALLALAVAAPASASAVYPLGLDMDGNSNAVARDRSQYGGQKGSIRDRCPRIDGAALDFREYLGRTPCW